MIKAIHLRNFQSHEDTRLELSTGVNVLIGTSDSGKSAVLRGLRWACFNMPSGQAYVSSWIKDKSGKPSKDSECSVELELDGHVLKRFRSGSKNGYVLDGQQMEAVRTEVPATVQQALKLDELNFQGQHDRPFLVSATAGEVARYFNAVVGLDDIDQALAIVNSTKAEVKRRLEAVTADSEESKAKIDALGWVAAARADLDKAKEQADQVTALQGSCSGIRGLLEKVQAAKAFKAQVHRDLSAAREKLDGVEERRKFIAGVKQDRAGIADLLRRIEEGKRDAVLGPGLQRARRILSDVQGLVSKVDQAKNQFFGLGHVLGRLEEAVRRRGQLEKELLETKAKIPQVCPTCGQPLGVEHGM